jgi:hypothetical protein
MAFSHIYGTSWRAGFKPSTIAFYRIEKARMENLNLFKAQ